MASQSRLWNDLRILRGWKEKWLATNGVASIVCFPGIMYRGGAEQKIRKYLIDNNYVDCIIQLPANLFFVISNLYTVENSGLIRYELAA